MKTHSVPHARTTARTISALREWVRTYTGNIGKIPTWQFIFHVPFILVLFIVSIIINQFKKEK